MMEIKVHLWQPGREEDAFINDMVLSFNSCQGSFRMRLEAADMPEAPREIQWEKFLKLFPASDAPCVILTGIPFADNWFSHCDGRVCLVSTHGWHEIREIESLRGYILLEFCLAAAFFSAGLDEHRVDPHEAAEGCLFDMCNNKRDVLLKLRAGYICAGHSAKLAHFGATQLQVGALQMIAALARAWALGREDERRRLGAINGRRIFVVHGRANAQKDCLVAMLRRLGFDPVVLMEEAILGRTIIEQIEANADVGMAFVLSTPDDVGGLAGAAERLPRQRQNAIFEYGLFIGRLGRHRVCCVAPEVPIDGPSDLDGVLQIRYPRDCGVAAAEDAIRRELRAAGYLVQG
jgi:predicted nucleotide-binding protein